ncbi:hypothetical protein GCM10007079_08270 [Nocardiopsis terrae]|uniref:DUF397 domain-containing protein n=1 Tax=Nocardiopsis terrae TaxID=372655 RepID=A0ABR9HPF1_9ACTN|nr:DUF397 domain-containing protein [Nocardiopsis terrae]MBE1460868.1 hypothetical protein [Nocardiopsis terrae]GHC73880.1 hypothetical protein GCM10007079_08270 [Nocardiopsis terrae]
MDGKPTWHKSTYSDGGSNCVEVRESASSADVRDTQNRELGHLRVPVSDWVAFLGLTR